MAFLETARIAALGFAAVFAILTALTVLLGLLAHIIRSWPNDPDTETATTGGEKPQYSTAKPTGTQAVYRVRVNDTIYTTQVEEVTDSQPSCTQNLSS